MAAVSCVRCGPRETVELAGTSWLGGNGLAPASATLAPASATTRSAIERARPNQLDPVGDGSQMYATLRQIWARESRRSITRGAGRPDQLRRSVGLGHAGWVDSIQRCRREPLGDTVSQNTNSCAAAAHSLRITRVAMARRRNGSDG
jgi:hypothetical protein